MKTARKLYGLFTQVTQNSQSLLLLGLRLAMAHVFVHSGWAKLNHLDRVIGFFASIGIPAPQVQAPFVAACEFGFGMLILLGLFTRLACVPMIVIMLVAILTAKINEVADISSLLNMTEFTYILILATLMCFGAGKFSLDAFFDKRKKS